MAFRLPSLLMAVVALVMAASGLAQETLVSLKNELEKWLTSKLSSVFLL